MTKDQLRRAGGRGSSGSGSNSDSGNPPGTVRRRRAPLTAPEGPGRTVRMIQVRHELVSCTRIDQRAASARVHEVGRIQMETRGLPS